MRRYSGLSKWCKEFGVLQVNVRGLPLANLGILKHISRNIIEVLIRFCTNIRHATFLLRIRIIRIICSREHVIDHIDICNPQINNLATAFERKTMHVYHYIIL